MGVIKSVPHLFKKGCKNGLKIVLESITLNTIDAIWPNKLRKTNKNPILSQVKQAKTINLSRL
jgi:hypothetical protein